MVFVDFCEIRLPFGSGMSVIHQEIGAVFMLHGKPLPGPMVVRHYSTQGNVVFIHQPSSQLSGPIQCFGTAVASIFTHFDRQALVITRTVKIGVLPLLIVGKVLHTAVLIH